MGRSVLPGISKWAVSYGGELTKPGSLIGRSGSFFVAYDGSYRSAFSSSPKNFTPSNAVSRSSTAEPTFSAMMPRASSVSDS